MNCDETHEYWAQSLRSGHSSPESFAMAEHLHQCRECRQAYEWDSAILTALLKNPDPELVRSFTADVCKLITEKELKGSFSLMNSLKSSADIILTAFVGSILWVVYHADIMRLVQAFVHSFSAMSSQILRGPMKVFADFDGINEIAFRSVGYIGQFPWALIACIASLMIVISYLVDLFPDDGR